MKILFKKINIIIIAATLFFACKENNHIKKPQEIIKIPSITELKKKINEKPIFSTFLDSSFIIPLETKRECIIGKIDKIIVFNGHIYVLDNGHSKGVFEFTMKGKFVRQYGKQGRGPNEYYKLRSFTINKEEKELVIFDVGTKRLLFFDLEGKFLKSTKIKLKFTDFNFFNKNYVIDIHNIRQKINKEKNNHCIGVMNQSGGVQSKFLNQTNKLGNLLSFGNMTKNDDYILYNEFLTNIIYKISNNKAVPFIEFDFQDQKIPKDYLKKSKKNVIEDLRNKNYVC